MSIDKQVVVPLNTALIWRLVILIVLLLGSLTGIVFLGAIIQDPSYHLFADNRTFGAIQNMFDVVSNLPFLIIGLLGIKFCLNTRKLAGNQGWIVFFVGVSLVSFGSMYYHWAPSNNTLLWDRLPMTVGFMGLFVAILQDSIGLTVVKKLLVPAVLLGLFSVLYWHYNGDLRFYYWIQLVPILTIPAVVMLFGSKYSHQWLLLAALGCYLLAKFAEYYDVRIFEMLNQLVSGHTIKHLFAAIGCYCILIMLERRLEG